MSAWEVLFGGTLTNMRIEETSSGKIAIVDVLQRGDEMRQTTIKSFKVYDLKIIATLAAALKITRDPFVAFYAQIYVTNKELDGTILRIDEKSISKSMKDMHEESLMIGEQIS